ncbi:hypothetical protein AJ79_09295 [Helicocarpus griseus UAMH5409]|uniref:Uncharacterized protein n=1 Tax=Helicocarpus griseus UAMH5409 TaxID=1447875 RepID=A0A2B7WKR1_9EURO|nr:hypothetical protein AJ79_09295 [Helicocarpus griseus UAMH5409]
MRDTVGRTPLSHAAQFGRSGIVKLLLDIGTVEVDSKDQNGITPLGWAMVEGRQSTAEIYDFDINSQDESGRTALWWAADKIQSGVLEVLLAKSDIDPNVEDNYGDTALSRVVNQLNRWQSDGILTDNILRSGRKSVVALLPHPAIDINCLDKDRLEVLLQIAGARGSNEVGI